MRPARPAPLDEGGRHGQVGEAGDVRDQIRRPARLPGRARENVGTQQGQRDRHARRARAGRAGRRADRGDGPVRHLPGRDRRGAAARQDRGRSLGPGTAAPLSPRDHQHRPDRGSVMQVVQPGARDQRPPRRRAAASEHLAVSTESELSREYLAGTTPWEFHARGRARARVRTQVRLPRKTGRLGCFPAQKK
jgi:hypothetical protein